MKILRKLYAVIVVLKSKLLRFLSLVMVCIVLCVFIPSMGLAMLAIYLICASVGSRSVTLWK